MACRCLSVLILKPTCNLVVCFFCFFLFVQTKKLPILVPNKKSPDTPFKPRGKTLWNKKTHKHQPFQHPFLEKKPYQVIQEVTDLDPQTLQVTQPWKRVTLTITEKFTKNCQVLRKVPKNTPQERFSMWAMFVFSGLTPTSFRSSTITQINNIYLSYKYIRYSSWLLGGNKKIPTTHHQNPDPNPWSFWPKIFG